MRKAVLYVISLLYLASCDTEQPQGHYLAFTGGTIIDGVHEEPIRNGVLLVYNGRIAAVGAAEDVPLPDHTEVREVNGKTIIPGLINAHGHVGDVKGIEGGHYSAENVAENLQIYARYGITTVVSLGGDRREAVPLRAVSDTTPGKRARLYIAGEVISGNTPAEAVAVVDQNDAMGVDFMKIRVDDNLGSSTSMSPEVYQAVITRSHEMGYLIATHMYYLEHARQLLQAGSDLLAHSVRDQPVDQDFIRLIKEKNVCYCPTLTRELSTFVYKDTAAFFSDPFFLREYDRAIIAPLQDPLRQEQVRNNPSAQTYEQQLPVAMQNLKTLADNGVRIAFGTDSGIPTRFIGYFEHLEMEMMAEAGLTPMQIIRSATKDAAECLKLEGVGTLETGKWADLVVLDENPLQDIRNTRSISEVWIGGQKLGR